MRLTHLICLAVVVASGTQAFAIEIYKGKMINHKEWNTGGARGKFVSDFNKSSTMPMSRGHHALNTNEFSGETFAHATSSSTRVSQPTELTNSNKVYYINNTNENHAYTYTFAACGIESDKVEQCLFYENTVELEPNGYFADESHPTIELTYTKPGKYLFQSSTQTIEDAGSYHLGVSTSYATMVVTG